MRKSSFGILFLVLLATLAIGATNSALAVIIDFDAAAFRAANDNSGEYGTITEWANGNGASADVPKAGQKVYYGTDFFNGWSLSDINYVEFTCRPNGGSDPYSNIVITDNAGNYGVISSQGGVKTDNGDGTKLIRYNFADNSGNLPSGFRFYEPAGSPPWGHGTNLVWSDIESWSILGVGDSRPLSAGEANYLGDARGPVTDGLAIMWGDSAANYLGDKDIYDVVVKAGGVEYTAGVPEPSTLVIWSLLGGIGIVVAWRNRKAA